MMETISDSEWMFLMDSVLYSKILTKKEADNLAKRITFLAGKSFSELTQYRHRMDNQPYIVGDEDIDEKVGHIDSRVLNYVHFIREAIKMEERLSLTCVCMIIAIRKSDLFHMENMEKYFLRLRRDIKKMCIGL